MEPPIRYARTSDGASIAYWALGTGPTLFVTAPLGASHLGLEWREPALAAWYRHMAQHRTVVRWDPRGSGLSDRGVELSLEGLEADVAAVFGALTITSIDILSSPGGHAIGYAAHNPDVVERLVLISPDLRGREVIDSEQIDAVSGLLETDYFAWTEAHARMVLGWGRDDQLAHAWAGFLRASRTLDDNKQFIAYLREMDYTDLLPLVRAKTLVIHFPVRRPGHSAGVARTAATGIPDAEFVEVERDQSHQWYANQRTVELVDEFLGIPRSGITTSDAREPSGGTAIVLYADIVDSVGLTERMGDDAFRDRARELDARLRSAISECGGAPVRGRTLGDGVLALFTAARDAIEGALRCGATGEELGLPLHLGVHAGDVLREGEDVYGGAVNIAARISALSAAGEILVSATVRELARTSAGVVFEDRGEHALKGIEEPLRLYAVRPQ